MNSNSRTAASLREIAAEAKTIAKIDNHHCHCFYALDDIQAGKFYMRLKKRGAYDQKLQEDHGQKWALTLTLDEFWQLHIKMMPNYYIESEVEPRIKFVEHITMPSKPGHQELKKLLEGFEIGYGFDPLIPDSCISRVLNTPDNPTDIIQVAMAFGIIFGLPALLFVLLYVIDRRK